MTSNFANALGLNVKWDNNKGLKILKSGESNELTQKNYYEKKIQSIMLKKLHLK
jgi:hypothetical protein